MDLTLRPSDLVEAVERETGSDFPLDYRQALAAAISDDLGVARTLWEPTFHAVLGPVLEASRLGSDPFYPTLVGGKFQKTKARRKVRPTIKVIRWLQSEERDVGCDPWTNKDTRYRLPIPDDSPALIPLDGDIGDDDVRFTTTRPDGVQVKWFSLSALRTGHILYRVDAGPVYETGEVTPARVTLYQKVGPNMWVRVQLDGAADLVDLPTALATMAGEGNRFTAVRQVSGDKIPLLRPAPQRPKPTPVAAA